MLITVENDECIIETRTVIMKINIFAILLVWLTKTFSLPKLYYSIWQNCRHLNISFLRSYERNILKLAKLRLDISFLQTCSELDIFPRFLHFRIPHALRNIDCKAVKRKALTAEIRKKRKDLSSLRNSVDKQEATVKRHISYLKYATLKVLIQNQLRKAYTVWKTTQDRKLFRLWTMQRPSCPELAVINKASYTLSIAEQNALRFGLRHHTPPSKVNHMKIQVAFEKLARSLTVQDRRLYQRLQQLCSQYRYTAENVCKTVTNKALHKTLRGLRENANIKICNFDKGRGTVILNSNDYYEKLDSIVLSDKFIEIPVVDMKHHPVLKTESSIQYYLNRYIKPHVSADVYSNIYPSGCQPGAIYGLVKVHKQGYPFTPCDKYD